VDPIARTDPVTQGAGFTVDLDTPLLDPAFDFTARAKSHARQYFLNAFFGHYFLVALIRTTVQAGAASAANDASGRNEFTAEAAPTILKTFVANI
jgi:hypothetical protein